MVNYIERIQFDNAPCVLGGDVFDGQWINTYTTLANNISMNAKTTVTFDMSTLLPNDNYDYLCNFMAVCVTGAVASNTGCVYIKYKGTHFRLCYAVTRVANTSHQIGNCLIPILNGERTIEITNPDANATQTGVYVYLRNYRRMGTNDQ